MSEHDAAPYQRKGSRESVAAEAKIIVDGDSYPCRILNISAGGAKLQTDRQFSHGKGVLLQIGTFGQFGAAVVWQRGGEAGMKFEHDALEMAGVIMGLASYG